MFRFLILMLFLSSPLFADDLATSTKLIANRETIAKGESFLIGLEMIMDDHWHTYWENPGSSGLPTTIEFEPVAGLELGTLQFPLPKRFEDEYNMVTFGYDEKVLLILEAVYRGDASEITLKGKANWLECKQVCIPGEAEVSLALKVGTQKAANQALFQTFSSKIPTSYSDQSPFTYTSQFAFKGEKWHGTVTLTPKEGHTFSSEPDDVTFLPLAVGELEAELTGYKVAKKGQGYTLDLEYSSYVDAVSPETLINGIVQLATSTGSHIVRIPLYPIGGGSTNQATTAPTEGKKSGLDYGIWMILLFGFLGGIILNLMPCVLPVLSLKVFNIIQDANMSPGKRIQHAWIVTAGIAVSFLVLSLFFIFSQAAGEKLGIGFQFQNPLFVISISALIFVMALSFFGVFHLEPPASNDLYALTQRHGWQGAFFQGALMTILSTPCTAPLLGTAYAWALAQTPFIIFLTFQVIAFGLAFPYLVLCHSPKLMRLLPKPGNWMNHFKIGLGFLLMATLIWLFSILWELTGSSGLIGTMALMLGLACAAYIFGQTFFSEKRMKGLIWTALVTLAAVYISMFRLYDIQHPFDAKKKHDNYLRLAFLSEAGGEASQNVFSALEQQKTTSEEIAWVPYSKNNVEYFRNQGRIVFLDFTAAWCATCKTNEKIFIDTKSIRTVFADKDVVTIKVDYTDKSDEITTLLNDFDRAGVPLYLFYPGTLDAIVLPEVINKSMLLNAVDEAEQLLSQKTSVP